MPNWCENRVEVFGSKEEIKRFVDFVAGTDDNGEPICFSFQAIKPMPEILKDTPAHLNKDSWEDSNHKAFEETGSPHWYAWCCSEWGTKWDCCEPRIDNMDEDMVQYYFSTAWSPPHGIYDKLVEEFPEVNISWFYDEPGMQVAGYLPD